MDFIKVPYRVVISTTEGTISGMVSVGVKDGIGYVSPDIEDAVYRISGDGDYSNVEQLYDAVVNWNDSRPIDEDGRVIPFPA